MIISELFAKDINRDLNGVINVETTDEEALRQELSEYVVTRELARHFSDLFHNYEYALDNPTNKVGVWISGFYGSGKSHFLKILSYLLSNKEVAGKHAIDYFDGKIEDEMVYSSMRRAASIPTETILFNMDSEGGHLKEGDKARTALIRAFTHVFYAHRGFCESKIGVARFESSLFDDGDYDNFKEAYKAIKGVDWADDRKKFAMRRDAIVKALQQGVGMSESAAMACFEAGKSNDSISIDELTGEIKKYVDARAAQNNGKFQLLFMADEVGQYINEDTNLMLNLQTIVEEVGSKCNGHVWVMVTSQEAIDELTKKFVSQDFSKIQGRFNTHLSLSSSSVDEVIKKRVLEKTGPAEAVLSCSYEDKSPVLKNLFTFSNAQSDLFGYASQSDFVQSYPFVSYQFKILPNVYAAIRASSHAGKHFSGGERGMLSAFKESAVAVQRLDTSILVPFWRFYDTLDNLDHDIRQVIERATRAAEDGMGLQPQDVQLLKVLYMTSDIRDFPCNIDNLTILMVDDIDVDKINLRQQVTESLNRLVNENYISRGGDTYAFLTDEEQKITREIKATQVDAAMVIDKIKSLIFDGIYSTKKYHLGQSDYAFDAYVDDTIHGAATGGMKLNIITAANELAKVDDAELAFRSSGQALVALQNDEDYYAALDNAAHIRKYVQTQNVQTLPQNKQDIIKAKQSEASRADREAREILEKAIVGARFAVDGRMVEIRAGKASVALDKALRQLVGVVYSKATFIDTPVSGDIDIKKILAGSIGWTDLANAQAVANLDQFLDAQKQTHQATSMGDIQRKYSRPPFGWREQDISALVALLIQRQMAIAKMDGVTLAADEQKLLSALTKRQNFDSLKIEKRVRINDVLLNKGRRILKDFIGSGSVPDDEDGLIAAIKEALQKTNERCTELLRIEYAQQRRYPGRDVVEDGRRITSEILEHAKDNEDFLMTFNRNEDALLDFSEDFEKVQGFFPNQQRIFDGSLKIVSMMQDEQIYLQGSAEVMSALASIKSILEMTKPYDKIKDLGGLNSIILSAHESALQTKKNEMFNRVDDVKAAIEDYAQGKSAGKKTAESTISKLSLKKEQAHAASTMTQIEAYIAQLTQLKDQALIQIDIDEENARKPKPELGKDPLPAQPRVKLPKMIRRSDACPGTKLTSVDQIDSYVENIRQMLLAGLDECGSVRMGD